MIRGLFAPLIFLVYLPVATALDGVTIKVSEILNGNSAVDDLHIQLDGMESSTARLSVDVGQLTADVGAGINIAMKLRCGELLFSGNAVKCKRGLIYTQPEIQGDKKVQFELDILNPNPAIRRDSQHSGKPYGNFQWRLMYYLKGTELEKVDWEKLGLDDGNANGRLSINGSVEGRDHRLASATLNFSVNNLNMDAKNSEVASESLSASGLLKARVNNQGSWTVNGKINSKSGAFYIDPIFFSFDDYPFTANTRVNWNPKTNRLNIESLAVNHEHVVKVKASSNLAIDGNQKVHRGQLELQSGQLENLQAVYLDPLIDAKGFKGVQIKGRVSANVSVDHDRLTAVNAKLSDIDINDKNDRFRIDNGKVTVSISDQNPESRSAVNWDSASLYQLSFNKTALDFFTSFDDIRLLDNTQIPLFDGSIDFKNFQIQKMRSDNPVVKVDALIKSVSLDRVTEAFAWPPMSGTLSGTIPGITLNAGRLSIDGALRIKAFDGVIEVNDLSVIDLLKEFPILRGTVTLNHIDLSQLTRKFSFGNIEGKLEGEIKNLYMENWYPVSFDAWFGTPDNDSSDHKISQKAVENLSSLGSGSVTDVFSRGILQFFDSFSYDRIGFGCQLVNDVCHLSGIGPIRDGYYIVKGGGLPRIDVIGYNHRVDWEVFIKRLKRISQVENAEIQ